MTIISFSKNFIFVKTNKTAGTSLEIALSKYCNEKDVIGPIIGDDENIRKNLGFRTAQNYLNKKKKLSLSKIKALYNFFLYQISFKKYINFRYKPTISNLFSQKFLIKNSILFDEHSDMSHIEKNLDKNFFKNAKKITIVRNPYTQILSYYHWQLFRKKIEPEITLLEFIKKNAYFFFNNELAILKDKEGKINYDLIIKFEELEKGIHDLKKLIKLDNNFVEIFKKIKTKNTRKIYFDLDKDSINIVNTYANKFFLMFNYKKI
jgi:hypothetical protein